MCRTQTTESPANLRWAHDLAGRRFSVWFKISIGSCDHEEVYHNEELNWALVFKRMKDVNQKLLDYYEA